MKSKVAANKTDTNDITRVLIEQIREALDGSRRILVTSHIDPDGDAVGTQLAFGSHFKDTGKEVILLRDSEIPEKYLFLPDVDTIMPSQSCGDSLAIDAALVLECPTVKRMGSVSRFLKDGVTVVNIDHHRNGQNFADINWIDTSSSSVGEMAWEYFTQVGYKLTPAVAEQLYTAVLTDTGRFRYESTSPKTMRCAAELIAAGANPKEICDEVYYRLRPEVMKLTAMVLGSVEFHNSNRICVLRMTKDMLARSGARESDSEGLVDYTLFSRGVITGALLKEVNDTRTRVSFRSNNPVDVSRIAARFGGGGHYNASGCTLPWGMERAREQVIRLLVEADSGER
jgi:phosphoesterase RecJ-like protein